MTSKVIDRLCNNAYEDTNLLISNNEKGDIFDIYRDVDFIINCETEEIAKSVSSFINDNRYGLSNYEKIDDFYRVITVINMPINQHILCSISGLMECVATLLGADYDGWGSKLQNEIKKG